MFTSMGFIRYPPRGYLTLPLVYTTIFEAVVVDMQDVSRYKTKSNDAIDFLSVYTGEKVVIVDVKIEAVDVETRQMKGLIISRILLF